MIGPMIVVDLCDVTVINRSERHLLEVNDLISRGQS
jgi:hypothetical protein